MEKDILKDFREDITAKELVGKNVLSLKILFPSNIHLNRLNQILYCEEGKHSLYSDFENNYIYDKGDSLVRTLTFDKYKESVKYSELENSTNGFPSEKEIYFKVQKAIDVSDALKKSKEANKDYTDSQPEIDEKWNVWCSLVKSTFNEAKSTLWSYIVVRDLKIGNLICSTYLVLTITLNEEKRNILNKKCQDYLYALVLNQFKQNILKQSNLNAIGVVMARNMSHNIGSHVLSRLVSPDDVDIDKFTTGDKPYYTPYSEELCYDAKIQAHEERLSKQNEQEAWVGEIKYNARKAYYNELLSTFFSYLKTRQDFLADVVTGVPQVQSSKLFKKELMEGIDSNRLLLNRISGVSNFPYRFQFEGKTAGKEEDIPVAISNDVMGQHAFYIILENIIRNTAKHGSGTSKTVHDPNLFTIRVEDSSLDSSHYQVTIFDDRSERMNEDVIIKFSRNNENYIKTRKNILGLDDTLPKVVDDCKEYPNSEEISKKEWVVAFTERLRTGFEYKDGKEHEPELVYECSDKKYDYYRIKKINKLIISQNVWINKPILDDEFKLRQGALGLIEMEACAAYLRRIPVEEIEADHFGLAFDPRKVKENKARVKENQLQLRILRAVNPKKFQDGKPMDERLNVLGYRFYLPKPKELLIIDETGNLWNEIETIVSKEANEVEDQRSLVIEKLKAFEKNGILLLSNHKDTIERYKNKDEWEKWLYDNNTVYPHEMLMLESDMGDAKTATEHLSSKLDAGMGAYFEEQDEYERGKIFESVEYKSAYLPNRILHSTEFYTYFCSFYKNNTEKYGGIFEKVEDCVCEDQLNDDEEFVPQIIDFLSDPILFKVEVKRAYGGKRFKQKNLKPFVNQRNRDSSDKLALSIVFDTNANVLRRKDEHHGDLYLTQLANIKNGCYTIFESKHESLLHTEKGKLKHDEHVRNQGPFLSRIEEWTSNVLIIDERIQQLAYQNSYTIKGENYVYAQLWDDCNVFIPPIDSMYDLTNKDKLLDSEAAILAPHPCDLKLDLNATEFKAHYFSDLVSIIKCRFDTDLEEKSKTEAELKPNNEQVKALDYLVIHLGVVEKLMVQMDGFGKSNVSNIEEFINKLKKEAQCEHVKVILTSGRGPTANTLPPNIAFLPYSVISQYMIENRLKYHLVEVLSSARAKKETI